MNKNPFLPQSSYAPSQPPLPPGPPPPPAPAHDYAAYWARNAAAPQNNAYNVNPGGPTQWTGAQAPRPPPPPTPEQTALYANYGYGPQSQNAWQRQQQQQQPPPQQFQPPPPPAPPPGYNPYQPYSPYVPQVQPPIGYQQQQQHAHPPPMHMPPQPLMFSAPQMMQQQHMPMAPMAPQQMMHQQQQGQVRHHSHGNLPPAKRQRFDGPQQGQGRMQPQQLQQQPTMPMSMVNASNRSGPMANSMNMQRGGAPTRGMARGRGGSNMNMGGHRGGRGGGGLGRNGSGFVGPGGGNRGGAAGGGRGGAGGGTFGATNNRRGGGAGGSNGSFTYRGGPRGQNYGNNRQNQNLKSHDGHGLARQVGSVSSIGSFAKKEERKRTLTDFRIVGLEICELDWRWGVVKEAQKVKEEEMSEILTVPPEEHGDKDATQPAPDNGDTSQPTITSEDVTSQSQTQTQDDDADVADSVNGKTESPSTVTAASTSESLSSTATVVAPALQPDDHPSIPSKPASADPPARIRIYFHTPVVAEETMISATRKGKRKKVDEDDEDTDTEERRPPPGPRALMHDDRSSMAPTVGSEPDWLMDAFAGGAGEVEGEGEDDDEEEVGKQLNPEPEGATEMDVETDNEMDYTQSGLPVVEVAVQGVENAVTVPGIQSEGNVDVDMHDGPSHVEEISDVAHEIAAPVVEGKNEAPEGHEHGHDGAADAVPPAGDDHDSASSTPSHANLEHPGPDDIEGAPTVPSSPQEESLQLPTEPPMSQEPETSQEPAEPIISATVTQGDADETEVPGLDLAASTLAALLMAQSEPPIHDHLHLVETASEQSHAHAPPLPPPAPEKQVPPASPNRLSISFARRRLVLDADVVESLRVFRKEGKVEVRVRIEPSLLEAGDAVNSDGGDFKGILVEGEASPMEADDTASEHAESATGLVDPTIPPLTSLFSSTSSNSSEASSSKQPPVTVTLVAYLDKSNPLSEARWVRTGDIREWVRSMCGGGKKQDANREESEGWEGKISVEDPDPPPTIHTILSNWASTSTVGTQVERERFVKTHMSEEDNLLEILLRLVRGERATANYNHASAPLSVGGGADPLLSTDSRQTHVSLAVLAIYRMAGDYAERALGNGDEGGKGQGKKEVAARIGEMIRTVIPMHLIHKSLEGMFKEWRMERRGR